MLKESKWKRFRTHSRCRRRLPIMWWNVLRKRRLRPKTCLMKRLSSF